MSTHTAAHQPPGRPEGGQFAPQHKPRSGLRLVTETDAAYEKFRGETDRRARWSLLSNAAIAAAEAGLVDEPVTDAYEEPFANMGTRDQAQVIERVVEQVEAHGAEHFGAIAFDETHRLALQREQEHWSARYHRLPRPAQDRAMDEEEILDAYAGDPAKRLAMLRYAGH